MPTVIAYHEVNDQQHWLASANRQKFFGTPPDSRVPRPPTSNANTGPQRGPSPSTE